MKIIKKALLPSKLWLVKFSVDGQLQEAIDASLMKAVKIAQNATIAPRSFYE